MSIGMIDTSNRQVRPISELSRLTDFSSLQYRDPVIHPDGSVEQTVQYMKDIVRDHYKSVQKIADLLYDPKQTRFFRKIFKFVMDYVKYEKDSAFMEQLRVPMRTLQDQKGDCDCMSILIGAILYAKNIPFNFRITKYNGRNEFQHVYVVVPRESGYTVIDPVILEFDKEKPFDEKKDFLMDSRINGLYGLSGMPIQLLNGVDLAGGLYGLYGDVMQVVMGTDLMGFGLGDLETDEAAMYNYLVRTRDVILSKPQMFKVMKNPLEVARMIDYAIRYWDTPQIDHVLDVLDNEEQRLLQEKQLVYPVADLSGDELGDLGFFKKIKKAVKKVGGGIKKAAKAVGKGVATAAKKTGQAVAKGAKAVGKGVATAAKKTGQAVVKAAKATGKAVAKGAKAVVNTVLRFNPVSLAARGGLLLAIRMNMFKLADKLQYGLYTEAQATAAGIKAADFRNMQDSYHKARKIFVNTLKGKEDKFKNAIAKGIKNKAIQGMEGLNGLGALGAAPVVVAALGFITSILGFFKGKKNPKTGEIYEDENVSESDVNQALDQAEMYDEDGNPIQNVNTTEAPEAEQNFWQKATGLVKTTASNLVNNILPQNNSNSGGSRSYNYDTTSYEDEYEDDEQAFNDRNMAVQAQSSALAPGSSVTTKVMAGGMLANVGNFIKKNALFIGIGAVGIGAAVYFLNKKRKSKGLSGIPYTRKRSRKTTKTTGRPRTIKAIKLH